MVGMRKLSKIQLMMGEKEKEEYKQKVVKKYKKRIDKLNKKLEQSQQQFQNSEKQVEECKVVMMKMEEENNKRVESRCSSKFKS